MDTEVNLMDPNQQNYVAHLYRDTVEGLELPDRVRFANVSDQLSRIVFQQGRLLGPVRPGSPVFSSAFQTGPLPFQLTRHVGLNPSNETFQSLSNFLNQRGVSSARPSIQTSNPHFLLAVDLPRSVDNNSGDDFDRPVLLSYVTFTHARQVSLNEIDLGEGTLPNLRLLTLGQTDLSGSTSRGSQQILTNGIIVPRSMLNISINRIPSSYSQSIQSSLPAIRGAFDSTSSSLYLGRSYTLLEEEGHYRHLFNFLSAARTERPVLRSVEQDMLAFQNSEPTVDVQQQIVTMEFLRSADGNPEHIAEILTMADTYRTFLLNDRN